MHLGPGNIYYIGLLLHGRALEKRSSPTGTPPNNSPGLSPGRVRSLTLKKKTNKQFPRHEFRNGFRNSDLSKKCWTVTAAVVVSAVIVVSCSIIIIVYCSKPRARGGAVREPQAIVIECCLRLAGTCFSNDFLAPFFSGWNRAWTRKNTLRLSKWHQNRSPKWSNIRTFSKRSKPWFWTTL